MLPVRVYSLRFLVPPPCLIFLLLLPTKQDLPFVPPVGASAAEVNLSPHAGIIARASSAARPRADPRFPLALPRNSSRRVLLASLFLFLSSAPRICRAWCVFVLLAVPIPFLSAFLRMHKFLRFNSFHSSRSIPGDFSRL